MTVPKYPAIMDTTWPLGNTVGYFKFCITNHLKSKIQSVYIVLIKDKVGYFKFCITNHLKSKIQSVCIVLIKDKNCNTVCTSPEGGMDIQIKTLHRCMNEYNSSPQYVKGGNINY